MTLALSPSTKPSIWWRLHAVHTRPSTVVSKSRRTLHTEAVKRTLTLTQPHIGLTWNPGAKSLYSLANDVCVAVFTAEFVWRWVPHPRSQRHLSCVIPMQENTTLLSRASHDVNILVETCMPGPNQIWCVCADCFPVNILSLLVELHGSVMSSAVVKIQRLIVVCWSQNRIHRLQQYSERASECTCASMCFVSSYTSPLPTTADSITASGDENY